MWRALVFIGLLALAAYGAVWLADRPGEVLITYSGYRIQTTVAIALVLAIGTAFFLALLWAAVSFLLHLPSRWSYASRARRRARGFQAVSRGMVAVGAGDPIAARRAANEAERLLGREPLTLLLKAQAAQVSGNRDAAEATFRSMANHDETRVLGLRGLFIEARRQGDLATARSYAQEAARLAPAVKWANEALLEAQCAEGDWRGALATVQRRASIGLIDKTTAKRDRAVLLTADALARADRDEDGALASALDAVKLAPDLVPAAALAGKLLSRRGDLRRAARIIETAWKATPHPDLASVYINLRPGDSAQDRMKRAETLAQLSSWDPEARIAIARTAIEAQDFVKARHTLEPLIADRPTMRVCLMMADLEQAEHGATGRVREWLARASRAPRDAAWVADGYVSDRWLPTSPVTGHLDAFKWQTPPALLAEHPAAPAVADETAGLGDKRADAPTPAGPEPAPEPTVPVPSAEIPPAITEPAPSAAEPVPSAHAGAVQAEEAGMTPAAEVARKGNGAAEDEGSRTTHEPKPVTFPVEHAPDDPGPTAAPRREEPKSGRFRLFGG